MEEKLWPVKSRIIRRYSSLLVMVRVVFLKFRTHPKSCRVRIVIPCSKEKVVHIVIHGNVSCNIRAGASNLITT